MTNETPSQLRLWKLIYMVITLYSSNHFLIISKYIFSLFFFKQSDGSCFDLCPNTDFQMPALHLFAPCAPYCMRFSIEKSVVQQQQIK